MSAFLLYIFKVALLTAAFVLLYHVLISRDTFYGVGRKVLVGSLVIAYILPFCVITIHKSVNDSSEQSVPSATMALPIVTNTTIGDTPAVSTISEQSELRDVTTDSSRYDLWLIISVVLYFSGVVGLSVLRGVSIHKVLQIINNSHILKKDNVCTIMISSDNIQPFSWMKYIIVPESIGEKLLLDDVETGSWERSVLCHERAHVTHHHSIELLFTDFLSVFQWFNPAVWLLRHDLCNLHEYQADSAVLNAGYEKSRYQESLLNIECGYNAMLSVNGIGISNLRSRMLMMNCQASGKKALLKYLYLPLLMVASLILTSNKVYDRHEAPYVLSGSRENQSIRRLYEYPDTDITNNDENNKIQYREWCCCT